MVKTTPKQSQSKSTNKTTTSNFSKAIIDNLIDNTKGSKPKVVEKPVKLQQEVTDLKNLSQHQQNLVRLLKSDTKVKTSMIDNIVETLDLKSGRVSPNGMKELIKVSMYFKGIAQGIRDSEGYRLNDSLNHQIKDAFKPFVADMTNDIKDGDILLLQKIGTKVETPVLTRKDFKPTLSTERSEKKRIAEENKAKAEKQVFETKAQIWLKESKILNSH